MTRRKNPNTLDGELFEELKINISKLSNELKLKILSILPILYNSMVSSKLVLEISII